MQRTERPDELDLVADHLFMCGSVCVTIEHPDYMTFTCRNCGNIVTELER